MELCFSDPLELSSHDSTFTLLVLLLLMWGCCLMSCIRLHWVKVCWSTYQRRCGMMWTLFRSCELRVGNSVELALYRSHIHIWYHMYMYIHEYQNIYIYIHTHWSHQIGAAHLGSFQDVLARIGSSWQGLLDCAVHQWIGWLGAVSVEGRCRMLVWVCWINLPQSTWWFVWTECNLTCFFSGVTRLDTHEPQVHSLKAFSYLQWREWMLQRRIRLFA